MMSKYDKEVDEQIYEFTGISEEEMCYLIECLDENLILDSFEIEYSKEDNTASGYLGINNARGTAETVLFLRYLFANNGDIYL